ncbi:hypothetical protein JW859_01405, partial [bacterium]|nr:hypothetical protein [bacterium]
RRFRTYRHTEREFEVRYTGRELAAPVARHTRQLLSTAMDGAKMRLTHVAELDPSPTGKLIQYVDLTRNGHGHGHPD